MDRPSRFQLSVAANAALATPAAFGVAVLARRWWRTRQVVQNAAPEPPSPIRRCSLSEFDPVFAHDPIFGPSLETEVRFVGRGNIAVLGGTTDFEAWILAVLAKRARHMFEFGTCTGKTTYLWAVNSAPDAHVTTLTLPPEAAEAVVREPTDDEQLAEVARVESVCTEFMYTGTPVAAKVTQLFVDSKAFDEKPYVGTCDLIFVDGGHTYSYVASDSAKALRMVRPGGVVLWHDYYNKASDTPGVYRALNELATRVPLVHLEGTALVAYRRPPQGTPVGA